MIPKLIIHPEIDQREKYIQKLIIDLGFNLNHPDLMWFGSEEKLGIEQARKIKNFLKLKPFKAEEQVIIIVTAENLTMDAQNALLKTLEEHASGVIFILGITSEDQLLPTIISRCQSINLPIVSTSDMKQNYQKDIEKLISSTLEQRFQFIEKLKDKEEFLLILIFYFRDIFLGKSLGVNTIPPQGWIMKNFLKDLIEAERWKFQNVNIRAILEHLMLKMPQKLN